MSNISKEILRNHINYQKFISSTEGLTAMKGRFKDVSQEPLEAEMDLQLGYDKYDISDKQTLYSRNDYSRNIVKSELGADWWVVKDESNCFIMMR
jgi:transposase-like protein